MPFRGQTSAQSAVTERLARLGAKVFVGHAAENAAASDVVVTSSAVARDNPEVLEARTRKIPVIQRAEMLAELMRLKYGIAIAGMHGKTTTTSMVAAVLAGAGLIRRWWSAAVWMPWGRTRGWAGRSIWWRRRTRATARFLKLSPILGVVTNLDREHMDTLCRYGGY